MDLLESRHLWQLAEIDNAIAAIRKRATHVSLAPGLVEQYRAIEKDFHDKQAVFKSLHADETSLKLEIAELKDKSARLEKTLFSGSITNAREVQTHEKELESLAKRIESKQSELASLGTKVKEAENISQAAETKYQAARKAIQGHKKKVDDEKVTLEAEFKRLNAARPDALAKVGKPTLARYEAVKKRGGGVGMVKVDKNSCGGCHTALSTKTIELAKEGKFVTCESCHRLLYYTEGLI